MGPRSDSELVEAARGGEASAFGELVARHSGRTRALAREIVGADADAEDVAQDAVLAAFVGLDRLRDPQRFGGWLYAIAVNLARMRVRARPARLPGGPAVEPGGEPETALDVRAALLSLPAGEREVVVLHYFQGLACAEIGGRLSLSTGAVRVRLHRARGRLRHELAHLRPKEAPSVTEVLIHDVLVRAESGAAPYDQPLRVVLLKERDGERLLPIWIGVPEGDALAIGLGGEELPRPLTSDLTARLVEAAGARVERVTVSELNEKTFYAIVALTGPRGTTELDARPSDALNLAVRTGAPVFVADDVLKRMGLETGDLARKLDEVERSFEPGLAEAGDWRSLSGADVKAALLARTPR